MEIFYFSFDDLVIILLAYLFGGVSTGYLLVRFSKGVDVRTVGSGSTGARNVSRVLGRKGFFITLLGDTGKASAIVAMVGWLTSQPAMVASVILAIIAGNIWSIWLQFRGGKGIASYLGAWAAYDFTLLLVGTGLFLTVLLLSRNFLLSWISALCILPWVIVIFKLPQFIFISSCLSTAMVTYAHRDNIKKAWLASDRFG